MSGSNAKLNKDDEYVTARLRAMCRMLAQDGHMTPVATRQILNVVEGFGDVAAMRAERDAALDVIAAARNLYGNTGGTAEDLAWQMWLTLNGAPNPARGKMPGGQERELADVLEAERAPR